MNDKSIMADCLVLNSRNQRVFRTRQHGSATVLWLHREDVLNYLLKNQAEKLQAGNKGR